MVPVGRSWLQVIFILIVDITWYYLSLYGLECSKGQEKKRQNLTDLFSPRQCQIQDGKPTKGTGGSPSHLQPTCLSVINYYPSLCLIYVDLCNYILANASQELALALALANMQLQDPVTLVFGQFLCNKKQYWIQGGCR